MSEAWHRWRKDAERLSPRVAVILGSGLGAVATRSADSAEVAFADVPNWPSSSVVGHAGKVTVGRLAGVPVVIFQGRFHLYEGRSLDETTAPVRLAHELGASAFIATNAAGGIRDDLHVGQLVALGHHRYWRGVRETSAEPPASPYSRRMIEVILKHGVASEAAVYGNVTGPCYETAAEIRAMRFLGIDAIGMSTAAEIDAAFALGMECAAISCVTNRATGLADGPHDHAEVVRAAASQADRLADLIEAVVGEWV